MNGADPPKSRHQSLTLRGRRWQLRWLSDLDDAVLTAGDGAVVRAEVIDALLPWLHPDLIGHDANSGRPACRLSLDPGGAALGAVVDSRESCVWLGSPGFQLERRLAHLLPDGAAQAHATRWLNVDPATHPFDVEEVTANAALTDLLNPDGALHAQLATVARRQGELAAELSVAMKRYRPSFLERLSQWGLGLQADYPVLRVHALRFVAMLPALSHDRDGDSVSQAVEEMLRRIAIDASRQQVKSGAKDRHRLPRWLLLGVRVARWWIPWLPDATVAQTTRAVVRRLAGIFIAGETIAAASPALTALDASGRAATVDQLGELVLCEAEADSYRDGVLGLIDGVAERAQGALKGRKPGVSATTVPRNSAGLPLAHVSIKLSALCAHYDADDAEGTWARVGPRLLALLVRARRRGVFIHVDAEHYAIRDLSLTMLRRALRADDQLWTWPDVGIVVQAYLRDAAAHLDAVLALSTERSVVMPIRLVKGAYWDAETIAADAHSYDAPQWLNKAETDLSFQQLTLRILAASNRAQLCIGSHNLRDHCFARAARELMHPDAPEIEHQALHATFEALSTAMAHMGWAVRNYIPVGSLLVGMAYLVRRVMENASQVGVLTMARGQRSMAEILRSPQDELRQLKGSERRKDTQTANYRRNDDFNEDRHEATLPAFTNLAPCRLHRPAHRAAFEAAIQRRALLGDACAGPVDGCRTYAAADVGPAVSRAVAGHQIWHDLGIPKRCALLLRAAERLAARRDDFAVLVAVEAGKARREALADVDEAVDFLRFYALEAIALHGRQTRLEGRGVIAVIAPWNFPLAIPCGMTAAALATGNAVLLKSAEQTPRVADALVSLLHEVGVPANVLQHLPGRGEELGPALTRHPDVAGCVFTGSKAVGTLLHAQLAAQTHVDWRGRRCGKLVITEMGGKNAVIITANADLDEAIDGCLHAAFSHAGQKCSAASRLLIDHRIFAPFMARFSRAAADLVVGPSLAPGTQINPVIDPENQARLCREQDAAAAECARHGGRVWLPGGALSGAVRPAIFSLPATAALRPDSLAQRELFGPVVHAIPFSDLDEAVTLFNSTAYALTGGIFAQREDDIDYLLPRLRCGNLYVNRSITGARVAIEPFGGFAMSGTGPKAGGRDYLAAFLVARSAPARNRPHSSAATGSKHSISPPFAALLTESRAGRTSVITSARTLLSRLSTNESFRNWQPQRLDWALQDLAGLRTRREVTLAVPGQESYELRDLTRGPMLLLVDHVEPGGTGITHLVAALACGRTVLVVALPEAADPWRAVVQTAHSSRVSAQQCTLHEVPSRAAATAWLAAEAIDTVVIDGERAPWSNALGATLAARTAPRSLPQIWSEDDGPGLFDAVRLVERHTLVRTITVNTLRHGASLDLTSAV